MFASEWSQAQLLQVMEEIEPMAAEALSWVHALAVAAVGSYERLGALLEKKEKDPARAEALRLGLVAGLETPESLLLQALAAGAEPQTLKERFGHMPMGLEGEIAHPRLENLEDAALTDGHFEVWNWDVGQAQNRRQDAEAQALSQAGMLGRSGLRKVLELAQQTLVSHAQAMESLAFVLAAARHWAMAAASEGADDGRILDPNEIFMLEIEEIKQMMTGEWHSRAHVETLIQERRAAYDAQPADDWRHTHALGVAGYDTTGLLLPLDGPDALQPGVPAGFMAMAQGWHPGWWRVVLQAEGLIDLGGHLLSWSASVARSGNLPALTGGGAYADWPAETRVHLIPARHTAEAQS